MTELNPKGDAVPEPSVERSKAVSVPVDNSVEGVKKGTSDLEGRHVVAFEPDGNPAANDSPEVPVNDQRYIVFGLVFLLLTLGVFSAWAGFAPLSSALIAPGEVVVNTHRKSIQHYEGGIIETIFVKNGDLVQKGQPLIRLDDTQFKAQLENSYKRLQIAKAELERLTAEQNFSSSTIFSRELQEAAEKDTDVADALKQQSSLLTARISAYTQESEALQTRLEQTAAQISGLESKVVGMKKQLGLLAEEEAAYTTLYNEGLGDNRRARELNRSIITTQNEINSLIAEIARLHIQNTETKLQVATRKQDFLKEVGERIKQTQTNYFDILEKYQVAVDRSERAVVRAPEEGTIVDMQVHTLGSVASPGKVLMDLVPIEDSFVVESKVMPQDINDIYVGQLADIRFSAFDAQVTKVIEGEVINVSADRLIEQRDQVPYYLARIQVTNKGRYDMTDDMKLKPGMPAEVMIQRGERTLFNYLLKPLKDSFARSLKER